MKKSELKKMIMEEYSAVMKEAAEPKFEKRADEFLKKLQAALNAHFKKSVKGVEPPTLSFTKGSKFWRVVRTESGLGNQRSVYLFLDVSNGDILKPAGWNAPTKGGRGNIFAANYGLDAITPYGVKYKTGGNFPGLA